MRKFVTGDIRCAREDRRVLVLVDFSNAFNAVDHDLLLAVLRFHKISDPAVSWFSSYLRGRQQAIRCGSSDISDWADLSAGVPQGGILSPLLFLTFINLVTSNLLCSYHLYADDLQIYNHVKLDDLDDGIAGVNSDLEEILRWSRSFGISVNPTQDGRPQFWDEDLTLKYGSGGEQDEPPPKDKMIRESKNGPSKNSGREKSGRWGSGQHMLTRVCNSGLTSEMQQPTLEPRGPAQSALYNDTACNTWRGI
ncbi:unnamed protein product [Plutella xylostella]|uniref:(diamondback moth) hypothetical protein n=1 Tax=Plutella xylostella TaxID=51655 RepID=A0A8S4FYY1_PLUXY|nr:unnamed protein product [Plutella xylostella]